MKKRILTQAIVLLALFTTTINLQAQVTIGSGQQPNAGALLDLKNLAGGNADKGLALPRVKLTSLTIPAGKTLAQTIDGTEASDSWDKDEHLGLLVYNMQEMEPTCIANVFYPAVDPGVFIWDGEKWEPLIPPYQGRRDITMTDIDDNVYNARWFGVDLCDGAYWTTSNLYVTRDKDGNPLPSNSVKLSIAGGTTAVISSVSDLTGNSIPANIWGIGDTWGVLQNNPETSYLDFAKEYGLYYNHRYAPLQLETICPMGWHVPDNDEWDKLADAFGGAADAARKMRKADKYGKFYTDANGYANIAWGCCDGGTPEPSGFDAVPSGWIEYYNGSWFGLTTAWWSSTVVESGGSTTCHYRQLGANNPALTAHSITFLSAARWKSIRCVRD
ncbi:FISUMP domain-containing protein [Dysgonomonas sp. 25]|uniref:FISUMP domain-containing protein n=1 Tax=Dysgonomonas sp. 25 TaxID=2302933 RepID=UPI0013D1CFC0|nr:FISUMP domain-containing protein [Dysgonomonas sp. 25]NDV68521.1 hypothetical protein [Dysgonomonas sp. 25]